MALYTINFTILHWSLIDDELRNWCAGLLSSRPYYAFSIEDRATPDACFIPLVFCSLFCTAFVCFIHVIFAVVFFFLFSERHSICVSYPCDQHLKYNAHDRFNVECVPWNRLFKLQILLDSSFHTGRESTFRCHNNINCYLFMLCNVSHVDADSYARFDGCRTGDSGSRKWKHLYGLYVEFIVSSLIVFFHLCVQFEVHSMPMKWT